MRKTIRSAAIVAGFLAVMAFIGQPVIRIRFDHPEITVYEYRNSRFTRPVKNVVVPRGEGIYGDETVRRKWLKVAVRDTGLFALQGFHKVAMSEEKSNE